MLDLRKGRCSLIFTRRWSYGAVAWALACHKIPLVRSLKMCFFVGNILAFSVSLAEHESIIGGPPLETCQVRYSLKKRHLQYRSHVGGVLMQHSLLFIPLIHSVHHITFTSSLRCHLQPHVFKTIHFAIQSPMSSRPKFTHGEHLITFLIHTFTHNYFISHSLPNTLTQLCVLYTQHKHELNMNQHTNTYNSFQSTTSVVSYQNISWLI